MSVLISPKELRAAIEDILDDAISAEGGGEDGCWVEGRTIAAQRIVELVVRMITDAQP